MIWLDVLVICLYFTAILWVGMRRTSAKETTVEGYALGGRDIPWWAVTASILASEISAATFLGSPGEGYDKRNFTYIQLGIGTVIARIIVAYVFLLPYYQMKVVSIYEFLEIRFGVVTRNLASALFIITRLLASGTRLYIAAVIAVLGVEFLTGFEPDGSQQIIIYAVALAVTVALTTLYTSHGGIRAVVWTDVIQASIMVSSVSVAIWLLLRGIEGGWPAVLAKMQANDGFKVIATGLQPDVGFWSNVRNVLTNEYTIFAALSASVFTTLATHGTDQDMVQRMLTAKDHHKARRALIWSGIADIPIVCCFVFVGILLGIYYEARPETAKKAEQSYVFAYYIIHEMPAGLRGLLLAGVLSTAMGSLGTAINALATSFTRDWWIPYLSRGRGGDDASGLRAIKISTVVFGVLMVVVGVGTAIYKAAHPEARIIPIVLGVMGYTYGSLLGIFLLGMLTRNRGSDLGNIIGAISGILVVILFSDIRVELTHAAGFPGLSEIAWLPIIAFPWRILFGTVATVAVAACFPGKPQSGASALSAAKA